MLADSIHLDMLAFIMKKVGANEGSEMHSCLPVMPLVVIWFWSKSLTKHLPA